MQENSVQTTFLTTVKQYAMFSPGDAVVAGLSGGADSTALCCLLAELKTRLGLSAVVACHLHHGIRGAEADRDLEASHQLCSALGLSFVSERADIPALAREQGRSTEDAGRRARYALFDRTADALAASLGLPPERVHIATAHTLSDNAETVLLNLTRGASLTGLCGIPPVRGRIVRPLIDCDRASLEAYLQERGVSFVEDSTNRSDDYRRNRIRHRVLPALLEENPRLLESIAAMTRTLRADERLLSSLTSELLERACLPDGSFDRPTLDAAPEALRYRASARLLAQSGAPVDARKTFALAEAVKRGSGAVSVAPGCVWRVRPKRVFSESDVSMPEPVRFFTETSYTFGKWTICGEKLDGNCKLSKKFHENGLKNLLDCDRITGTLILRARLPGDVIRLAGRGCEKRVKKLFSEAGLLDRDRVPILADALGPVWIAGFGAAQRVFPSPDTQSAVYIQQVQNKE